MKRLLSEFGYTRPMRVGMPMILVASAALGMTSLAATALTEDSTDFAFYFPEAGIESLNPSNQPISLNPSLDISRVQTILDTDDRLRMRLENAISTRDELELSRFLDMEIGPHYKRQVLLTLGEIFGESGSPSRQISLYEKFATEFPTDSEIPKIYLNMGRLYREMGASNMALSKFYNVLNVAIKVDGDSIDAYQEISHLAQLEIAETHFQVGEYSTAARFYNRLMRLNLTAEDMQTVLFKYAYATYLTGSFRDAIAGLSSFVHRFPEATLSAEARYLLADSHLRLNDNRQAMIETLNLLRAKNTGKGKDADTWLYWKKRTGNQIANLFYHQNNYMDALAIYQAMADLSDDPSWRWPVLYQIGLCFEKLLMKPKAVETYRILVETSGEIGNDLQDDRTLIAIGEMAKWRMQILQSELSMEQDLRRILSNS